MKNYIKKPFIIFILALSAGCATPQIEKVERVFYPEPPTPAHLQYLTYFTGESDITSKKSAFETFVTGAQESQRRLDKPYGVAIQSGKIYVSDVNNTVIIFDLEKREYRQLQGAQGIGKLVQPVNIRIDAQGYKYVSDPLRAQVVVYDKNDFYVTSFAPPEVWKPVDAVVYEDLIYVADMKDAVIVVMDKKTGEVVRRFGQLGEPNERLARPTNLAFDTKGHLYVSDAGRFQIVKFDRDGHYLGSIGDLGSHAGKFARPRGVALDRENRMYTVDAAFDNVQLFNNEGGLLLFFGQPGGGPGDMFLPAQVIVDYDNVSYFKKYAAPNFDIEYLVIVTNQFGAHSVNIYGFGKERGKKYPSDAELKEQLKERLNKALKAKPTEPENPENKEKP